MEDHDVEIKIVACGVCGSDVHTITGAWSPDIIIPMITGHEIAGIVAKVGSAVKDIKVGDRVGVGAQIGSCLKCKACTRDNENYCPDMVDTYNAKYPNGDIAHGGYSTAVRAHERYVFPIPDALEFENVAPMLCAGLTVYSPLVRNGCTKGSRVGVVGLGGLGHYAVMFASALGAEVSVLSHSDAKKADALAMGATNFYAIQDNDLPGPLAREFDIIINTRDAHEGFPIVGYMQCLGVHGKMIQVGLPDEELPPLAASALLPNGAFLGGSHIGNKKEALAMLKLAAEKNIKSWIEVFPMKDAGKAVQGMIDGKSRYRYVLKQDLIDYKS